MVRTLKIRRLTRTLGLTSALCVCAAPSFAQMRAWSHGIQDAQMTTDECLRRAESALAGEGYATDDRGGVFRGGDKGIHRAQIVCAPGAQNRAVAYIVVMSIGTADGGVAGLEREQLQTRKGQSGPAPMPQATSDPGRVWQEREGSYQGVWTRRGSSNVFEAVWNGYYRSLVTITIQGNRVFVARRPDPGGNDGNSCDYQGTLSPDGVTVQGIYSCTNLQNQSWSATIQR